MEAENTQVALRSYNLGVADFSTPADLQVQLSLPGVGTQVSNYQAAYYTVNIADALSQLKDVGELLGLAYAGTKGRQSAVTVVSILGAYQSMVKDSFVATGSFTTSSLSSLEAHRYAYLFIEKGKFDDAYETLAECAEVARQMSTLCVELKAKAQELTTTALRALEQAETENAESEDEKIKIQERIQMARVEEAEKSTRKQDLEAQLESALIEEREEVARQDKQAQKDFIMKIVSHVIPVVAAGKAVADAVGQALFGQASAAEQSAADRRLELMRVARYEKEKELRENNALLARQLTELNNLSSSDNNLKAAVQALGIAITSLGKIKTIFDNTRLFWDGVEKNCLSLVNSKKFDKAVKLESASDFLKSLKESAFGWMCLANINIQAHEAMVGANATIDSVMISLPTAEEARQIIHQKVPEMLRQLDNQTQDLDRENAENIEFA